MRTWRAAILRSRVMEPFQKLAHALSVYVLPQPRLLRNEEIQLEIRQAWYRNAVPRWILRKWRAILILTGIAVVVLAYLALQTQNSPLLALLVLIPVGFVFVWAAHEWLLYQQRRLFITNRRTIIYVPDPRTWLLVDSARLQAGKIQVIDTSFSSNPWWGMFQTWTGARNLVISLSAYEFKPDSAEVKGGLIFPDVMPEDIVALEEIVFPKK